ncbi:hypothetical protein Q7P37_005448 [Cladosporium fusiforme]
MAVPPETLTTTTKPSDPPSSNTVSKQPTSSHRLPTVSASEAFRDLSDDKDNNDNEHPPSNVFTQIPELDDALGGGFESGKVTELWGPPGAGKTAIALSATASVLQTGSSVVWIDTTHPLSTTRAHQSLPPDSLPNLHQTLTPTLSHLLTLLLHPPHSPPFPPPKTRLLVLTNLHLLLEASNPRSNASPTPGSGITPETYKFAAARRPALLGTLASLLNQLAARHKLSVLVTTGCATRMTGGNFSGSSSGRLGLVPGVGGREWESGVWARAGAVRDFGGRVVGVSKARGAMVGDDGEVGRVVRFAIEEGGGVAVAVAVAVSDGRVEKAGEGKVEEEKGEAILPVPGVIPTSPVRGRKRTVEEIADSDSDEEEVDEYGGWAGLEEGVEEVVAGGEVDDGDEQRWEGEASAAATSGGKANATIVIDD